jgi:hypothetical protein
VSGLVFVKSLKILFFCSLSAISTGFKLRSDKKNITYTTLRELFIEAIKPHVEDVTQYGLHSLRSGGATAAANNGIPERLFKRHGLWLSENAKDGYVEDEFNSRLRVSQSLGL